MKFLSNRPFASIVGAIARPRNYSSVIKTFSQCKKPVDFLRRYLTGSGQYPVDIKIRTPLGYVTAIAFCSDDVLTVNEIFFRGDYGNRLDDKIIVDFGSNIGISTIFFLSRNSESFSYCYEPLSQNAGRLSENLRKFTGRYELQEAAVAEKDGTVTFGWEPTGRYGGIGKDCGEMIEVPALDSNRILREIIARHGGIDLLKIDIESLEHELTARIPPDLAVNIRRILVELKFDSNPLPDTHDMTYRMPITTLLRRAE